jgi:hypothetical protein
MDLLMNGLLTAATLFAGGYCWVLSRRVRDLKSLDTGLGGAIVTLTRQVELARTTLEEARSSSRDTRVELAQLVSRADAAAGQLKLLIAAAPAPAPSGSAPPPAPTPAAAAPEPAAPTPPRALPIAPVPLATLAAAAIAPAPEAAPAEAAPVGIPKPRALAPIENPLRRARANRPPAPARGEDEIIEALRALAGGT